MICLRTGGVVGKGAGCMIRDFCSWGCAIGVIVRQDECERDGDGLRVFMGMM